MDGFRRMLWIGRQHSADHIPVSALHVCVHRVADWPYSSFIRFVEHGIYPLDWGCDGKFDICGGE